MRPVGVDYMPIGLRLKCLPFMPVGHSLRLAFAVGAAQCLVAMREAAEAFDHLPVVERELQEALVFQAAYQPYRLALVVPVLAMFERQIEKQTLVLVEPRIQPQLHSMARDAERDMVGGKGLRRAAKALRGT